MTQLSNVLIIDNSAHYQNELSVIKTFNNWVIFKADVWAINLLLLCHEKKKVEFISRFVSYGAKPKDVKTF